MRSAVSYIMFNNMIGANNPQAPIFWRWPQMKKYLHPSETGTMHTSVWIKLFVCSIEETFSRFSRHSGANVAEMFIR